MILLPRYPKRCLGHRIDDTVHAWETRPWAQELVADRAMQAAAFARILQGQNPLADDAAWTRRRHSRRQGGFLINPFRFGGVPTDPNFANVSLLINPAGADTNTTFIDLSSNANTLTAVGNAQHDTGITHLTSSSIQTDGTGDAVTAPDGTIFDFGSGHYTLECWIYVTAFFSARGLIAKRATSAVYAPFNLHVDGVSNKLGYVSSANGSSWGINLVPAGTVAASTWTHAAADFDGTTARLYQGGAVVASAATALTVMTNTAAVSVSAGAANGDLSFEGRIGPTRVTKGVARYAGAFTPPTSPYPTS